MNEQCKKKSTIIYILEFVIAYIVVTGFLSVVFYERLPETGALLFASLIIATGLIGAWEKSK